MPNGPCGGVPALLPHGLFLFEGAGGVTWKDKRKNANAIVLTYCVSMSMFVRAFCVSGYCKSWMPFVFACAGAAVLAGVVLYKARQEKAADAV